MAEDMPHPGRLTLVEDDAALQGALKFALEVDGYEVRVFADAESLLADPAAPQPDCLVVDQRLPGMTGLELVKRLREQGLAAPAILISTPTARTAALAAAAGVPLVGKPLMTDALVEEVRRQIAARIERDQGAP
jgi:FixJ family two-component response regulator